MAETGARKPRLLLVDDGPTYAEAIAAHLPEFALVQLPDGQPRAPDGPSALHYLAHHEVDAVLLDMRFDVPEGRLLPLPGESSLRRRKRFQGLAILQALREVAPRLPVVLLTSEADLALSDVSPSITPRSLTYVLGGEDLDALRIQIHAALTDAAIDSEEDGILWGQDLAMAALRRRLSVVSRGRLPVLLEGETGTGKSLLAERFVHRRSRRSGTFVVLDLSTVPTELIAAHLFGATRGAYTGAVADRKGVFEAADGGTLFIDEIQNVPLEVQKQLLLVLQEGRVRRLGSTRDQQVDVKVVVASNAPLQAAVDAGRFRADLYMRLSPATRIAIPPLRARRDDLRFFVERFIHRAADDPDLRALRGEVARAVGCDPGAPLRVQLGHPQTPPAAEGGLSLLLPAPAVRRLMAHPWPGNLRELSMVMHNLLAFTLVAAVDALADGLPLRSPRLQVDGGLVDQLLGAPTNRPHDHSGTEGDGLAVQVVPRESLNDVAQDVERQVLVALFRRSGGDFQHMSEQLLGDRSRGRAVRLRFNQLGLRVRDFKRP